MLKIKDNNKFCKSLIEEDKKIDNIRKYYDDELEEYVAETFINNKHYQGIYGSKYDEMMIDKINQLIDKVKNFDKTLKEMARIKVDEKNEIDNRKIK